jgi:hypothetical protein
VLAVRRTKCAPLTERAGRSSPLRVLEEDDVLGAAGAERLHELAALGELLREDSGTRGKAAAMRIASNGASSGRPPLPSPTTTVTFS